MRKSIDFSEFIDDIEVEKEKTRRVEHDCDSLIRSERDKTRRLAEYESAKTRAFELECERELAEADARLERITAEYEEKARRREEAHKQWEKDFRRISDEIDELNRQLNDAMKRRDYDEMERLHSLLLSKAADVVNCRVDYNL